MSIKIKYQDPKSTDFGPNDIVINATNGTIFYKSNKSIFKLQGDDLNTTTDSINFDSNLSAQKAFFKTPGIGDMVLGSQENNIFEVGVKTIEVGGSIIPSASASPRYDLGSPENPFRDIYVSENTFHFIKTRLGVGGSKVGTTFKIGRYQKETIPNEEETLTQENVTALKAGKSIQKAEDLTVGGKLRVALGITLTSGGITGSIDGGSW